MATDRSATVTRDAPLTTAPATTAHSTTAHSTTAPSTATRWLDPVEMAAWRTYIDSVNALQHALELDVVPFGLTMGDYEVLVRLSERPDRRERMCDLAAELRLSPSGLTRRLDGLVRSGLVGREPSVEDRRVMLAVLTDDGYELLVEAAPHHVEGVRRRFIDLLTRDEVVALGTAFTKVRDHLLAEQTQQP